MTIFFSLCWPFLVCAVLVVAAVALGPNDSVELLIPIGLTQIVFQGSSLVVGKILLVVGAVVAISIPAFRDYSHLYPLDLRFNVSFDDEGLQSALDKLTARERSALHVAANWQDHRRAVLASWNELIRGHNLPSHVTISEATRGTGYVTFRVVSVKGWQAYQISAAQGQLKLQFPNEGQTTELRSDFELIQGPSSRIEGSLADIYVRWTKIIRPRFAQSVQVAPLQRVAVGELIAVTKLRFFPMMTIGRTLYLAEVKNPAAGASVVPIAYADYET